MTKNYADEKLFEISNDVALLKNLLINHQNNEYKYDSLDNAQFHLKIYESAINRLWIRYLKYIKTYVKICQFDNNAVNINRLNSFIKKGKKLKLLITNCVATINEILQDTGH